MKQQDFYNEEQALFDAKSCEQDMAVRHLLSQNTPQNAT